MDDKQREALTALVGRYGAKVVASGNAGAGLPVGDPNQFWHTYQCNLHTISFRGMRTDQAQLLDLKGAVRVQYIAAEPGLYWFLDVDKKTGKVSWLHLNRELQYKESEKYANVKAAMAALERQIAALDSDSADGPGLEALRPHGERLSDDQALERWQTLAKAANKVRAKIDIRLKRGTRLEPQSSHQGLELDTGTALKALYLELQRDKDIAASELLCSVVAQDSLDGFAAQLASHWVELKKRTAPSRWILSAASALGADETAEVLGGFLWKNRAESKGHTAIVACVGALARIATPAALHEIYTLQIMPTRYTRRRNEAQKLMRQAAGAAGMPFERLIARIVPRHMSKEWATRVRAAQSARFERMMADGIRVDMAEFIETIAGHPVLADLGDAIVWGVFDAGDALQATFRLQDGAPVDSAGKPVVFDGEPRQSKKTAKKKTARKTSQKKTSQQKTSKSAAGRDVAIGIPHPVELEQAEMLDTWKKAFRRKKREQPIKQLARPIYHLTRKQAESNQIQDFKRYNRDRLHAMGWWGYKVDMDYMSDVDTFAVLMPRDGKQIEAKLDGSGQIHAIGMGRVELDYSLSEGGYVATPGDKTTFGELHPVSQSELLYAFKGDGGSRRKASSRARGPGGSGSRGSKFPYAEVAKSGRSSCLVCEDKIAKGAVRVAVERQIETDGFSGVRPGYLHAGCAASYPELAELDDMDAHIRARSSIPWPLKE